jgi:hypothetical protein
MFRNGIAAEARGQDHHNHGYEPDPRASHFPIAHLNSLELDTLLARPHRRLRSSIVPKLIAAFGYLGLGVTNIDSASRNRDAQ